MTEDPGVLIHLYVYLGKRTVKGARQGPQHGSQSIHLQPLGEAAPREEKAASCGLPLVTPCLQNDTEH